MSKLLIAFGTRPELIKLAPVISAFKKRGLRSLLYIVHTNQHQHFLSDDLAYFNVEIDYQLRIVRNGDSLSLLQGELLLAYDQLNKHLNNTNIALCGVMAQGDTCSTYVTAQFAFYQRIQFFHIEAGLRTYDFENPFPEEFYRKSITQMTAHHFVPTINAQNNLLKEGIPANAISLVGNTCIDNLLHCDDNHYKHFTEHHILITIHRRENISQHWDIISKSIQELISKNLKYTFIWIENPGFKITNKIEYSFPNLIIIAPKSYEQMMQLYKTCKLIITDSGGLQEEAAFLGIPLLLARTKTERIEGNDAGISQYLHEANKNLDFTIDNLKKHFNPQSKLLYGDGYAAERIVTFLIDKLFTS